MKYFLAKTQISRGMEVIHANYLVDAVNLTDVEVRIIGTLGNSGENYDEVKIYSAKQESVEEILNIEQQDSDQWYKAVVELEETNPDNLQSKLVNKTYYIAANSLARALYDLESLLANYAVFTKVKSIAESNIEKVIPYDPEEKFIALPERLKPFAQRAVQMTITV